jgi:RNA polymerase sigma-70 factor (ECF subfamily)
VLSAERYARELKVVLAQAGGYARALLRDRDAAEDAVQQAALRGWERIAQYDEARPFRGWWFAILRHCCIDMRRRAGASPTQRLGDLDPPAPTPDAAPDWERLDAAIALLSADHHEILRLRYYGDLSYAELAEALSIPKGTVMSRLHLARKALAALLREESQ